MRYVVDVFNTHYERLLYVFYHLIHFFAKKNLRFILFVTNKCVSQYAIIVLAAFKFILLFLSMLYNAIFPLAKRFLDRKDFFIALTVQRENIAHSEYLDYSLVHSLLIIFIDCVRIRA